MAPASSLPHIAIFPFMAKGHTIPLLHLAHLIQRRRLATLTFFTTPRNAPFLRQSLANSDAAIVELPFPQNIPELPKGVESTDCLPFFRQQFYPFVLAVSQLAPHFEQALETIPPVNMLISDVFLGWTKESATKFGIPRIAFNGLGNFSTVIFAILYRDLPFATGADVYHVPDFTDIVVNTRHQPEIENEELHAFFGQQLRLTHESRGLLMNSFYELEPSYYDHWNSVFTPKSWCIGPLCLAKRVHPLADEQPSWLTWLDSKSAIGRQVVYVAFGTQAQVSESQLAEIALGLENSEVDFLWVVTGDGKDLGLIKEMEERVGERGLVARMWVDQSTILRHEAVKVFVSHCGWNSVIEGICAGVSILAWPIIGDQLMNAKFVVEKLGVGLEILASDDAHDGVVSADVVETMVKRMMLGKEGKKAMEKVEVLADAAKKAMDVGGPSWCSLEAMISEVCGKSEATEIGDA